MEDRTGTRIFVYGSLLAGEANHGLLAGARRLGPARTAPGYALVDLGPYPGLVAEGDGRVAGEVYAVDAATLDRLDRLEDVPRLYVRAPVPLDGEDGAEAYLYARTVAGLPRVAGGDWRRRAGGPGAR